MSQSIKRKDFLTLTISIATLSAVSAVGCGDDDDSTTEGGAGKSGGSTGGSAGKGSGGSSAGNSPEGGKNNNGGTAGKNNGGSGGTNGGSGGANGGSGGKNNGGNGGKNGHAGEGGESYGGEGGESYGGESYGGEGGAGGAGGDGPGAAPKCGGAKMEMSKNEGSQTHSHITDEGTTKLTVHINSLDPTSAYTLPFQGHTHDISFTQGEIDTLRSGGTVARKESTMASGHMHVYKISCG